MRPTQAGLPCTQSSEAKLSDTCPKVQVHCEKNCGDAKCDTCQMAVISGFGNESFSLPPTGERDLEEIIALAKGCRSSSLDVRGYTDSTGSDGLNRILANSRAEEVKEKLISHGFSETSIVITDTGKLFSPVTYPGVSSNPANRRVEVILRNCQRGK